jgi:glutaredoxin
MLYRWAGVWGPFRIRIPCGECALTRHIIDDVPVNEAKNILTQFVVRDWLNCWWQPLFRGGWHAPIVMVEGALISQGGALNRGLLARAIAETHAQKVPITGNVVYGKQGCPHCLRARKTLADAGIKYVYHNVVREPMILYDMLSRIKTLVRLRTPITVPQIWINGLYIGGASQLAKLIGRDVEPNPDRGQCSPSPDRRTAIVSGGGT